MQNFNVLANLVQASLNDVENLERQATSFRNIICAMLTDLGVDSFQLSFQTMADGTVSNLEISQDENGIKISMTKPEDFPIETEGVAMDDN